MDEKVQFINADGLKLTGTLSKPKKETAKCIILCHGITSDKDEGGVFKELAEKLTDAGFAVFRFDFRGSGDSEGNSVYMTVTGQKRDLESAVQYVLDRGYMELGILAASFAGGAVALLAGQYSTIAKAYVLWNSLLSYESLLKPTNDWTKKYWGPEAAERAERNDFTEINEKGFKVGIALLNELQILEPIKELKKASVPMLFIHGSKDTHVDPEDSQKFSKEVKKGEVKIIDCAEHGFHNDKKLQEEAINAAVEFIEKNV